MQEDTRKEATIPPSKKNSPKTSEDRQAKEALNSRFRVLDVKQ